MTDPKFILIHPMASAFGPTSFLGIEESGQMWETYMDWNVKGAIMGELCWRQRSPIRYIHWEKTS
jgi:hypothetical protein